MKVPFREDFKYGSIIFFPRGDLRREGDRLRAKYDPLSARAYCSHITISQPLKNEPSPEEFAWIEETVRQTQSFWVDVGPAIGSPNNQLLWLDVNPKEEIIALRERLHASGLFRTDLPYTKGFIPHLTISETKQSPEDLQLVIDQLNKNMGTWRVEVDQVAWSIPDNDFVFNAQRVFYLNSLGAAQN